MATTISLLILAGLLTGLTYASSVILRGTREKTRWGITLSPKSCPACGVAMPVIRVPNSLNQALWGGSTCQACGTEMDKWGRRIATKV